MSLLDQYPLKATEDEDSALRVAICRLLAAQVYRISGGASFSGFVADEVVLQPDPPELMCLSEWADGETVARYPFAVVLDATGQYESCPVVDDEKLIEDGGSKWCPTGDVGAGPAVTLRTLGSYEVTFSVMLQANDRPMRSALVRGARSAFKPADPYAETGRDSLVVELGDLYWSRRARFQLVGLTRTDTEASGATKMRSVIMTVRASIPVVEPVELDLFQSFEQTPPDGDSELSGLL